MMTINRKFYIYLFAIGIIAGAVGCSSSGMDQYNKLVKKELAKGTRVDSIFLGINFGMSIV